MNLDILIAFANRLEHVEYGHRINSNGMYMAQGNLEVYRLDLLWYGYQETDGGSSQSTGFDNRDDAVNWCIEQAQFMINFWNGMVDHKRRGDRDENGNQVIRARNRHYICYPEDSTGGFSGYGGRQFEFKLLANGRLVRSRNVWTQGLIPVDYRNALPDNAVELHTYQHLNPVGIPPSLLRGLDDAERGNIQRHDWITDEQ